jgi:nicotinamide-nucleotide amidase
MNIEIVSIGNELLAGDTINTNVSFISKLLNENGYIVSKQSVLSDDKQILKQNLLEIIDTNDLVITTGGLGPTCDDNTKEVICEVFNDELAFSEDLASDLKNRFGEISSIDEQATIPRQAKILKNIEGTAPGFVFTKGNKTMIVLPGVPFEMKLMFEKQALIYILQKYPLSKKAYSESVNLCLLKEVDIGPFVNDLHDQAKDFIDIGIYPYPGTLKVKFTTKAKSKEEASSIIKPYIEKLLEKYSKNIFPSDLSLEEAIYHKMEEKGLKLAVAESCSGGNISAKITSIPYCSKYFLGSIVAYSNEMKQKLLNVNEKTIESFGAVSKETVAEMIKGVFANTDADYAIAVSGIAGPSGGSKEKPVGTVCIGVANKANNVDINTFHFTGSRSTIVEFSTNYALGLLWQKLKKKD